MGLLIRGSALCVVAAIVALATASASSPLAAGTLNLQASFSVTSDGIACPPEMASDATDCRTRAGTGRVPGLGSVSLNYIWAFRVGAPLCAGNLAKPLATTARFVVVGKGEIQFALAEGAQCVDVEPVRNEPQDFRVTGGTGAFESASGSGTAARSLGGGVGTERWTGTLAVTGVEFDTIPPTIVGATSKTVRARKGAKRVRVTYTVTANDDVDGAVPISCDPRSGTRFPIGRTVVKCSATDTSGNTANTSFRVTVRATR